MIRRLPTIAYESPIELPRAQTRRHATDIMK